MDHQADASLNMFLPFGLGSLCVCFAPVAASRNVRFLVKLLVKVCLRLNMCIVRKSLVRKRLVWKCKVQKHTVQKFHGAETLIAKTWRFSNLFFKIDGIENLKSMKILAHR